MYTMYFEKMSPLYHIPLTLSLFSPFKKQYLVRFFIAISIHIEVIHIHPLHFLVFAPSPLPPPVFVSFL
jgi:hypothetical protein